MTNSVSRGASSMLFVAVVFCAAGCIEQQGGVGSGAISVSDVDKLGPEATWHDVSGLLKQAPLTKLPWFEYPAKEGGIFVFSFFPTNELAAGPSATPQTVTLVAVVKSPSHEAFMRGEGVYVYPKKIAGTRFTGFPLPTTTRN